MTDRMQCWSWEITKRTKKTEAVWERLMTGCPGHLGFGCKGIEQGPIVGGGMGPGMVDVWLSGSRTGCHAAAARLDTLFGIKGRMTRVFNWGALHAAYRARKRGRW